MSPGTATSPDSANLDSIHNITELYQSCPDFQLTDESLPASGTTMKVAELILLIAAISKEMLTGDDLGPSKPSVTILSVSNAAHQVDFISCGLSPALFLTKDMLECEVLISDILRAHLVQFANASPPNPIDENSTTLDILRPLFSLWVMIWTDASKVGRSIEWNPKALVSGTKGGDIDILIVRTLKDSKAPVEVAAIEAKTPCSCGHSDIANFGKANNVVDDALARQCVRHLQRCNKSMKDNGAPWSRNPTFGALMVYPSHFFPVAYQDDPDRFVLFADAAHVEDTWPGTRDKLENHMKAVSVAAAWAFMVVVNVDEDRKKRWNNVCPKQVEQAAQWTTTAGEQLASPDRLIATLMRCWTLASALVYQAVFSLLVVLMPLERFRALTLPNGDVLQIEPTTMHWRLPFNLAFPLPDSFHKSYTAQTFVFSSPSIVVKVYNNVEPYAHELAFYEKWSSVLGSSIPTLHASGRRTEDHKPCLILSNEGQRVTDLTEEDRVIIQRTVLDVIHKGGWHHHDLAARNVLRRPSGELCLIDFGMASKCDRKGCDNSWE